MTNPTLGITATRKGLSSAQHDRLRTFVLEAAREAVRRDALLYGHHGACIGGDEEFALLFSWVGSIILGVETHLTAYPGHLHYATSDRALAVSDRVLPRKHTLARNVDIVEAVLAARGTVLACPGGEVEQPRGSGTWATIRFARKARVDLIIIYPDGRTEP